MEELIKPMKQDIPYWKKEIEAGIAHNNPEYVSYCRGRLAEIEYRLSKTTREEIDTDE